LGSEAKGKIASFLSDEFDIAVRTGSPNSGHTILKDNKVFSLRQIERRSIITTLCKKKIS